MSSVSNLVNNSAFLSKDNNKDKSRRKKSLLNAKYQNQSFYNQQINNGVDMGIEFLMTGSYFNPIFSTEGGDNFHIEELTELLPNIIVLSFCKNDNKEDRVSISANIFKEKSFKLGSDIIKAHLFRDLTNSNNRLNRFYECTTIELYNDGEIFSFGDYKLHSIKVPKSIIIDSKIENYKEEIYHAIRNTKKILNEFTFKLDHIKDLIQKHKQVSEYLYTDMENEKLFKTIITSMLDGCISYVSGELENLDEHIKTAIQTKLVEFGDKYLHHILGESDNTIESISMEYHALQNHIIMHSALISHDIIPEDISLDYLDYVEELSKYLINTFNYWGVLYSNKSLLKNLREYS